MSLATNNGMTAINAVVTDKAAMSIVANLVRDAEMATIARAARPSKARGDDTG
jgi:hypothetical protein